MIKDLYIETGNPDSLNTELSSRRLYNDPVQIETRGKKPLLSEEVINRLERLIWDNSFEGRIMSWDTLAQEAGIRGQN